jgi:cell division protein FtsQ
MSSSSVAWYLGEGNVWMEPAKIATTANQSVEDAALAKATSEGELLITGVPATVQPVVGSRANDEVLDAVSTYLSGFSSDFASQIVSFSAASVESISCVLSSGVEVSLGSPTSISSKETVVTGLLEKYPGELTYINVRVPSNPSYRRITSSTVQAGSGAAGSATDGSASTGTDATSSGTASGAAE